MFQDWRMGTLGKRGTECVNLLNKLEQKWVDMKSFGEQWILCDQLTMAVLIRPEVAKKTSTYTVSILEYPHINKLFKNVSCLTGLHCRVARHNNSRDVGYRETGSVRCSWANGFHQN